MKSATPFSIIVPTYKEAKNIVTLVKRIAALPLDDNLFEVIFVDDNSRDGIEEIVQQLSTTYPWVKLVIRFTDKGLSQSVMQGFHEAKYPFLIMMDADLSHPPEVIPAMLAQLEQPHIDMVIGSRYVEGGTTEEAWSTYRKIISKISALLARKILSAAIHDPLSGFIAIKKEKVVKAKIDPIGWKIGLEMLVKCDCKNNVVEIPITFAKRQAGNSKLTLGVALKYLIQLKRLFVYKYS